MYRPHQHHQCQTEECLNGGGALPARRCVRERSEHDHEQHDDEREEYQWLLLARLHVLEQDEHARQGRRQGERDGPYELPDIHDRGG